MLDYAMLEKIKLKIFGRRTIKSDVIRADVELLTSKHRGSRSIPEQYQGEEIVCSKCKNLFVFSARQKKEYYEDLGGKIYAKIHICPKCYRKSKADQLDQNH